MSIKLFIKKFTPRFLMDFYYWLWALTGAFIFNFPSRKLMVIGVTGTSGKSTTVDFIARILEEAGQKVASMSSVRFKIGDREWKNELKMTMPGRFKIQKFFKQAIQSKCKYAVLEVTSEGIKQFRHKFIDFNTAVFTNLSPEHIESHGGFENYRNEKLKLFKATKNLHIINADDENADYFAKIRASKKYYFGVKSKKADLIAEHVVSKYDGMGFVVNGTQFKLDLMGEFNVYNALAAISVGLTQGISLEVCKKALEKISNIPGRMDIVAKEPFLAIVDYAHTPEQLEQVYKSLSLKPLICVLGSCGGGRDTWKRPVLGKVASQYCKEIIITNEDPYDEDPLEIMEQIASGINSEVTPNSYHIVLDRKEAIKKAVSMAKPGDALIITGKGSEIWMCLAGGIKIPWSDKEIVKELLR